VFLLHVIWWDGVVLQRGENSGNSPFVKAPLSLCKALPHVIHLTQQNPFMIFMVPPEIVTITDRTVRKFILCIPSHELSWTLCLSLSYHFLLDQLMNYSLSVMGGEKQMWNSRSYCLTNNYLTYPIQTLYPAAVPDIRDLHLVPRSRVSGAIPLTVTHLIKQYLAFFMEHEISLPCSQKPAIGPYPEPAESNSPHRSLSR
jgi:hypothetical protein